MKGKLKLGYSILLLLGLAYLAVEYWSVSLSFWRVVLEWHWTTHIFFWTGSIGILTIVYGSLKSLERRNWKLLEWRLIKTNLNFTPLDYKALRVPFATLFYFNLPLFAYVEELIFRDGWGKSPTITLGDAMFRSFLFGLVHLVGGVRLRSALVISVLGLYLSAFYIHGGIEASTIAHFHYNAIALTFLLLLWMITKEDPLK